MSSEDKIFDISFFFDGQQYKGWVNPSDTLNDKGLPVSFHVVLNDVSLGYLSLNEGKWTVNEDRPAGLVEAAGREISKRYAKTGNSGV
jgi:hypothetical protein